MKAIIFYLLISLTPQVLCAQLVNFNWAKQIGGPSIETGYSITTDAAGNVYTIGNFNGSVDFDPGPGVFSLTANSTADIFVSKMDSAGNFIWAKQMKGSDYAYGIAIALDNMRNIFITGSFAGGVDFDPGPGLFELSVIGRIDVFITKLDNDGNFKWAKQIGINSNTVIGNAIAVDSYGDVLVAGNNTRSASTSEAFISKLSSAGNFIWTKYISGNTPICAARDIKTDAAGNIFTTGYFNSNTATNPVDFDPGQGVYNLNSFGGTDIFVSKWNKEGVFVWAKQIGGTGFEEGSAIELDALGNVFITGFFTGVIDTDPGPGVLNLTTFGDEDILISKLDAAGNLVWAKQMGGLDFEEGNSIAVDGGGNVYITGHFYGTVDFDPGVPVYNLASAGLSDIFISKLDGNGNFRWAKQIGGVLYDWSYEITLDITANILTTGYFDNVVDFDIGAAVYNLTSVGNKDIFVHKMSPCNNYTASAVNASVCKNYVLNGQTYTATGTYTQYLINTAGCDSIITLNLTINNRYTTFSATACDSYSWNAQTYSSSGTYRDTFPAANGCDSVITLNLVINLKSFSVINAAICPGHNYAGYTIAGTYIDTLVATNSCDSIRTLNLTVNSASFSFIDTTICAGRNYAGYTSTGIYVDTLIAGNGCDSVRTLDLTVKNNCGIYIPNAFTPNHDGLNDSFKPVINLSFRNFSFIVFNRYGQKVFETTEYGKGWDGSFKGKDQPSGSYVYHIKFTNIFGVETVENGSVLLIR